MTPQEQSSLNVLDLMSMEGSIQELENQLNICLHINAMKIILSEIDAVHDISPSLQFQGRKRYLNEHEHI